LPSTQYSVAPHFTSAQLPTHRERSNVALGLQTSLGAHVLFAQGLSTHAPALHALPSAQPKKRQSPFGRHWPVKSPLGTHVRVPHAVVRQGPWQALALH
jgi:hypothetical protein